MSVLLLLLTGLVAAMIGSLVGLGGGIIIVPMLIFLGIELNLLDGITPQTAIGTSTMVLVFIGLSSIISYRRSKQVDMKNGMYFVIGAVPGAFLGSYTSSLFTLDSMRIYFGLFIILVSFILIFRDRIKPARVFQNEKYIKPYTDGNGEVHHYGFPPAVGIAGSFVAGFTSGLFGVGGGALMTPMMILLFLMPPSIAVGTSMFIVFFASFGGAVGHMIQGNINYGYALILIPAAYAGAKVGVFVNRKFSSESIVTALRIVLLMLGIYMIIQGFGS